MDLRCPGTRSLHDESRLPFEMSSTLEQDDIFASISSQDIDALVQAELCGLSLTGAWHLDGTGLGDWQSPPSLSTLHSMPPTVTLPTKLDFTSADTSHSGGVLEGCLAHDQPLAESTWEQVSDPGVVVPGMALIQPQLDAWDPNTLFQTSTLVGGTARISNFSHGPLYAYDNPISERLEIVPTPGHCDSRPLGPSDTALLRPEALKSSFMNLGYRTRDHNTEYGASGLEGGSMPQSAASRPRTQAKGADWERSKSIIHIVYLKDNMPLPDLVGYMSSQHNFYAT